MKAKELLRGKDVVSVEDALELLDIAFLEGQIEADPSVERCSLRKAELKRTIDKMTS